MVRKRDGIYVVSSGCYSDYQVLCAAPSKKDAETLVQRHNGTGSSSAYDEARVEWLAIVPGDAPNVSVLMMTTTIWDDGTETDTHERIDVRPPWEIDGECLWRWIRAPMHHDKGGRLNLHGTDHERIRKTFGDKRAALITDDALRSRHEMSGGK